MRFETSPTALFLSHPVFCGLLRGANSTAERMIIVRIARTHAMMILASAIEGTPVEKPSIVAAYRALGMEPTWMLNSYDDVARFCLTLRDFDPTPEETEASALLMACVYAEELGDVPEFSNIKTGEKFNEGRKLGTVGPVRKTITRLLKSNAGMKNQELWDAIKAKPPRGFAVMENRVGRYIEDAKTGEHVMDYPRFRNIAAEERKKLRG